MEINNVPQAQTVKGGKKFWGNLLRTILGTTISIILTFGTNALSSVIVRFKTAR